MVELGATECGWCGGGGGDGHRGMISSELLGLTIVTVG